MICISCWFFLRTRFSIRTFIRVVHYDHNRSFIYEKINISYSLTRWIACIAFAFCFSWMPPTGVKFYWRVWGSDSLVKYPARWLPTHLSLRQLRYLAISLSWVRYGLIYITITLSLNMYVKKYSHQKKHKWRKPYPKWEFKIIHVLKVRNLSNFTTALLYNG